MIGYGAIIAIAAFLAEIHVVNTCAAILAMRCAVLTKPAASAKLVYTFAAVFAMVFVIASTVGILAAMVAAIADPVVGDKLAAIYQAGAEKIYRT